MPRGVPYTLEGMTRSFRDLVRATAGTVRAAGASWRGWGRRRHLAALLATCATVLVVALPTALIPNPVFGREIPPTAWAWPVLLVTAALSGLLMATYVREDRIAAPVGAGDGGAGSAPDGVTEADEAIAQGRAGMLGGLLTFLAVGCPVCNKLALIALGYAGALQWFAPVQPFLAGGGVLLLGWALVRRLANEGSCPLPRTSGRGRASIVG